MFAAIKRFFAAPKHVVRMDEMHAGQVIVEGAVRVGPAGTLSSPIKGQPCVAFVYTAGHRVAGRSAQLADRPLRNVEAFVAFELDLDGGRIEVVPERPGGFSREDHQALVGASYQNFHAEEVVVPTRARVRLRGVARPKGDGWVVTYRRIERLESPGKGGKRRR